MLRPKERTPHKRHLLFLCIGKTTHNALLGGRRLGPKLFMQAHFCPLNPNHLNFRKIPTFLKVYLWELILLGVLGGTAATYSAIIAIFGPQSITLPCYWGTPEAAK